VTCGCTHLSTFSVSADEIMPETNLLTRLDFRAVSFENLLKYPTVWVTSLVLFLVFLMVCIAVPYCGEVEERSVIAFEDIIYKSVQEQRLWKDIAGKEIKYVQDGLPNPRLVGSGIAKIAPDERSRKDICALQYKLWKSYLRNEHTLLALFQRTAGTNWSTQQRLGHFFAYLVGVMAITGTFYGTSEMNIVQSVLASFFISLVGTLPPFVIKQLFIKSKPPVEKSTMHNIDEIVAQSQNRNENENENENETKQDDAEQIDIQSMMTQRGDMTVAEFEDLFKVADRNRQIRSLDDIRQVLYDRLYPLPYWSRYIGWIIIVLWSIAAIVVAIVYGIQFDQNLDSELDPNNPNYDLYANSECWNTTLALQLEAEASKLDFERQAQDVAEKEAGSYAGGDSPSWLLSVTQSLLTSLIVWQPLLLYLLTWLKIWAFSWHLRMTVGPNNMLQLCKKCCCGDDSDDDNGNAQGQQPDDDKRIIAHNARPVDVVSFLGNDRWMINDISGANDSAPASDKQEVDLQVVAHGDKPRRDDANEEENNAVQMATMHVKGEQTQTDVVDAVASVDVEKVQAHAPSDSAVARQILNEDDEQKQQEEAANVNSDAKVGQHESNQTMVLTQGADDDDDDDDDLVPEINAMTAGKSVSLSPSEQP